MHAWLRELFPWCRSITGPGLRATLRSIGERVPLEWHEVPTGTRVLDWTIPNEWSVREAWLKDSRGRVIADFADTNLHIVNYSAPMHGRLSLGELRPHIFSLPDRPDWVPYRTSYYDAQWGFCLAHRDVAQLVDDEYEVHIDTSLEPGSLTYAECVLPGELTEEVLIACHTCHPSMANDSLSGVVVATFLAEALAGRRHRYTYRFLFAPATIGAIAWLARDDRPSSRVKHGLVLTCCGDPGDFTYKRSRRGTAEIDRVVAQVLNDRGVTHRIREFVPYGGDERQFCSPGFDLPVGAFSRTPYGEFPEYHTSADTPDLVTAEALDETLAVCLDVVAVLEGNGRYVNRRPFGEPQLRRHGLFRSVGGDVDESSWEVALLWILNLSDGGHSLLDIAERSHLPFGRLRQAADALLECGLIDEAPAPGAAAPSRPAH